MAHDELAQRMAAFARELQEGRDLRATVEHAVELAAKTVAGCDSAAISLVHHGNAIETHAATDDTAATLERLQSEVGEGPSLDAVGEQHVVNSTDVGVDLRWPVWGPRAVAAGMRSALCFRLFTHGVTVGALDLYAREPAGFDDADRDVGAVLAAHVAVAMAAAHRADTLGVALDTRTVIGQAQGILMERYEVDAEQAFAVLKRYSSTSNVKLREVARRLVEERRLPKE